MLRPIRCECVGVWIWTELPCLLVSSATRILNSVLRKISTTSIHRTVTTAQVCVCVCVCVHTQHIQLLNHSVFPHNHLSILKISITLNSSLSSFMNQNKTLCCLFVRWERSKCLVLQQVYFIVILKKCTSARLYLLLHKVICGLHVSTNK